MLKTRAKSTHGCPPTRHSPDSCDEADSLAGRALGINRKLLGERHPTLALNLNTLGVLRQRRGDLAEAERLLRDAMERYRERYGRDHASTAGGCTRRISGWWTRPGRSG